MVLLFQMLWKTTPVEFSMTQLEMLISFMTFLWSDLASKMESNTGLLETPGALILVKTDSSELLEELTILESKAIVLGLPLKTPGQKTKDTILLMPKEMTPTTNN